MTTTFDAAGREVDRTIARQSGTGGAWDDLVQTTGWQWHPGGLLESLTTRNGQDEMIEQRTVAYTTGGIFLNGHRMRMSTPFGPTVMA